MGILFTSLQIQMKALLLVMLLSSVALAQRMSTAAKDSSKFAAEFNQWLKAARKVYNNAQQKIQNEQAYARAVQTQVTTLAQDMKTRGNACQRLAAVNQHWPTTSRATKEAYGNMRRAQWSTMMDSQRLYGQWNDLNYQATQDMLSKGQRGQMPRWRRRMQQMITSQGVEAELSAWLNISNGASQAAMQNAQSHWNCVRTARTHFNEGETWSQTSDRYQNCINKVEDSEAAQAMESMVDEARDAQRNLARSLKTLYRQLEAACHN